MLADNKQVLCVFSNTLRTKSKISQSRSSLWQSRFEHTNLSFSYYTVSSLFNTGAC